MSGDPRLFGAAEGGQILTRELAAQNPEKFKSELFRLLQQETGLSSYVFNKLVERGIVLVSAINLDPHSWVGVTRKNDPSSNRQTITLGVAELPPNLREKIIFEHQRFDGYKSLLYRFSHELSHAVVDHHIKPGSVAMNFFNLVVPNF